MGSSSTHLNYILQHIQTLRNKMQKIELLLQETQYIQYV